MIFLHKKNIVVNQLNANVVAVRRRGSNKVDTMTVESLLNEWRERLQRYE